MKEYYICSKKVIEVFPDAERSKGFKTGYKFDKEPVFIAVLDFDKVKSAYNRLNEVDQYEFFCQEIFEGNIASQSGRCSLREAKKDGLFLHIERKTSLTKDLNRAYIIYDMCKRYGLNPIEFANKL